MAGGPDSLPLLEHPLVYTAGQSAPKPTNARLTDTRRRHRPGSHHLARTRAIGRVPHHRTGRALDVVNFVRRLEQSLIDVCAEFGLDAGGSTAAPAWAAGGGPARPARSPPRHPVARGVTPARLRLNCDCDLACVRPDRAVRDHRRRVTSLTAELGRRVGVEDVQERVAEAVATPRRPAPSVPVPSQASSVERRSVTASLRPEVRNAETPSNASRRGSRPARWARVHRPEGRWSAVRACTPSAKRPAAPTSTSAGGPRGHLPHRRRAAPVAATSARSTPAKPAELDRDEPRRVAESVAAMGQYATVTGWPVTTRLTAGAGCMPRPSAPSSG